MLWRKYKLEMGADGKKSNRKGREFGRRRTLTVLPASIDRCPPRALWLIIAQYTSSACTELGTDRHPWQGSESFQIFVNWKNRRRIDASPSSFSHLPFGAREDGSGFNEWYFLLHITSGQGGGPFQTRGDLSSRNQRCSCMSLDPLAHNRLVIFIYFLYLKF